MRYTVEKSVVRVIGTIWMPAVTCAMDYSMDAYHLENAKDDDGQWTRESVEQWLMTHSGDFQSIEDFEVDISYKGEDFHSPWEKEESECTYYDCMDPMTYD